MSKIWIGAAALGCALAASATYMYWQAEPAPADAAGTAAGAALLTGVPAPADAAAGNAGLRLETRRQAHPRLWDASRRAPGLSYRPD